MKWILLALILLFALVLGITSPEVKTRFKMRQSRSAGQKILDDFDAEQHYVDKYSK